MTKIALVSGSSVLHTWHAPTGEVATRYTLPDGSQISPVALGWRDDDAGYAVIEVEPFVVPEGKRVVGGATYEVVDGVAVETCEVEEIVLSPPDRVTARQFKLQLLAAGIIDQVEAWIETQDRATQIAYETSGTFVREDPMMASGFAALGFTEEQVDAFFIAAEAL